MIFKGIYIAIFLLIWFWIFRNYKLLTKERISEEETNYLVNRLKLGIFLFVLQFIVGVLSMIFTCIGLGLNPLRWIRGAGDVAVPGEVKKMYFQPMPRE